MAKKPSSLSWNDRLALIKAYNPSDSAICSALGVTQDELTTARDLEKAGTFVATADIDVESYSDLFGDESITVERADGVESIVRPESDLPPVTATKKTPEPKKRGRKGDKIAKAFVAIPASPTSAEGFASEHGVSLAVLRQSKRFDRTGLGTVRVKKDKASKELMIWRESTTS
jgi:hypothetical protein